MTDHIDHIVASFSPSLFALKNLRVHGLPGLTLQAVCQATTIAKLLYASRLGMVTPTLLTVQGWNHSSKKANVLVTLIQLMQLLIIFIGLISLLNPNLKFLLRILNHIIISWILIVISWILIIISWIRRNTRASQVQMSRPLSFVVDIILEFNHIISQFHNCSNDWHSYKMLSMVIIKFALLRK